MSRQRYLDTKFWDDTYIVNLDPIEKLLFIYLLTNPLTNICGIYETSLRRIAFDTGVEQAMVLNILKRFEEDGKVKYQKGYIVLKNFTKYQANNEKINKGIISLLKGIPAELTKWANIDFNRLGIKEDSLYIGLDRTSRDLNYVNVNVNDNVNVKSDILSTTNKEKEEREKKLFLDSIYLTTDEYEKLISEYGKKVTERNIENLQSYIAKTGKKYNSHYLTIKAWIRKEEREPEFNDEELPEHNYIDLRKELNL